MWAGVFSVMSNHSLKNDDESGVPDSDPRPEAGIELFPQSNVFAWWVSA
jgi:hypothetical protein